VQVNVSFLWVCLVIVYLILLSKVLICGADDNIFVLDLYPCLFVLLDLYFIYFWLVPLFFGWFLCFLVGLFVFRLVPLFFGWLLFCAYCIMSYLVYFIDWNIC
jgi:hypothetical protein